MPELREELAEYAHNAWCGWMCYMFEESTSNPDGTVTMPAWAAERWMRQADTAYSNLPEEERETDRKEADKMLEILKRNKVDA